MKSGDGGLNTQITHTVPEKLHNSLQNLYTSPNLITMKQNKKHDTGVYSGGRQADTPS
jgi:hypothetical protein